jgi:hypothetical protein
MVSRVSSRRWLLRDIPQISVLLVWAAFVVGILSYFIDWPPVRHETTARPQSNNGKNDNDDLLYTGSIIVPARGALCWEGMFDNRNGRMIDKGYVNCDKAVSQLAAKNPPQGMEVIRLRAIGKAFHHEND